MNAKRTKKQDAVHRKAESKRKNDRTKRKEQNTEKGALTARYVLMITPDSSNTVSKRPAPNPNFLFGRGVGFSLSGCCPTCSKSWRLGSQRGLCRSTRETRLRKEVEGKQFEGKQLEGNKFESKKRRTTFTAHFWPGVI